MKRDALVVGINQYPFLKDNPKNPAKHLQTPAADAEAIAHLLESYGDFAVHRLPAKEGVKEVDRKKSLRTADLQAAIRQLFCPQGNSIPDTALLFFAGHGLRRKQDGETEGFLATSEASPRKNLWGISLKWLRQLLQESRVRQQIIWLDCCHSGELLNFTEAELGEYEKGRDRCLIVASRDFQVAYGDGEHGMLTNALLQSLDPANRPDGWVTNFTLVDRVRELLKAAPQHPVCTNTGGQIILTGKNGVLANICPYKGLAYFDWNEEDPKYFYGRTRLTNLLLEKVRSGNFLAVLGASGSGKSSVVRAGLLYQLQLSEAIPGSDHWKIYPPFTPGDRPLQRFKEVVGVEAEQLEPLIKAAAAERVVLVVDQFEEVFTQCRDDKVSRVIFSPDSQMIASASYDSTVKLWSRDGTLLKTLQSQNRDEVEDVSFSSDGQLIAFVDRSRTIHIWNQDGILLKSFRVLGANRVSFSPDGKVLATPGESQGTIQLWTLDGNMLKNFQAHKAPILWITFSPDGKIIASASEDKTVKTWSSNGIHLKTFQGHSAEVINVKFSPDGKWIASASADNTVKLWSLDGTLIKTFRGHNYRVWSISFSPDGKTIASASGDQTIKLWRLKSALVKTLSGHTSEIADVRFSPDGQRIVTASWDKTIKLWQDNGRLLKTINGHSDAVRSVSFSPDNHSFATASVDKTIKIWDINGVLIKTLYGDTARTFVTFSLDGKIIASSGWDSSIELWNRNGTLFKKLDSGGLIYSINFSPDSQTFATSGEDKTVKLWSRNGTLLKTITGHSDRIWNVSFSPDSKTIASASEDGTIKLWNVDGKNLKTFRGHNNGVNSVSFSPDGQMIASAGSDETIKFWSIDGVLLNTFYAHNNGVTSVNFSPNGKIIASASRDKTVILWNLDIDNLLAQGCNWVRDYINNSNTNLKDEERHICDGIKPINSSNL